MKRIPLLLLTFLLAGCATTPQLSTQGPDALARAAEFEMSSGQYILAERRIDEMVRIGSDTNNPKITGDATFLRAKLVRLRSHEFDRALELLEIAEEDYENASYPMGLALVYAERGRLFAIRKEDQESCDAFRKALNYYEGAKNKDPNSDIPTDSGYGAFEATLSGYLNELKCD